MGNIYKHKIYQSTDLPVLVGHCQNGPMMIKSI